MSDDLRLAHFVLINALVAGSAVWFCLRRGGDRLQALCDAMLLAMVIVYASVAIPGLLGVLNAWTPSAVAAIACVVLVGSALAGPVVSDPPLPVLRGRAGEGAGLGVQASACSSAGQPEGWTPNRAPTLALPRSTRGGDKQLYPVLLACAACLVGALGYLIYTQRYLPPTADDSLTYHLPAAVTWLRTGHLSLCETWFFNPANTYSPLAGSTFIAWAMAPLGNDVAARFVQAPAALLIFLALARLGRALGAAPAVACLVALAAALSRPILGESILCKDDLYLSAFFLTAVAGCVPDNLRGRAGPWRLGAALGLMLATKYTALMALPVFLLAADAPWRAGWRWRSHAVATGVMIALAGGWFIRNAALTGNPIFPIDVRIGGAHLLSGLFSAQPSLELRSVGSVWEVLTGRYYSLPRGIAAWLIAAWLTGLAVSARHVWREALARLVLLGSAVTVAIFVLASPYAEVRFVYPAILLLFVAATMALAPLGGDVCEGERPREPRFPRLGRSLALPKTFGIAVAVILASGSAATAFVPPFIWGVLAAEIAGAVLGVGLWLALTHVRGVYRPAVAVCAVVAITLAAYRYWTNYLGDYRAGVSVAWRIQHAGVGEAWAWFEEQAPDAPVAYANTYLIYPLMGFDGGRRVFYVPGRPGVSHLRDLPYLGNLPGELITPATAAALNTGPDRETWLANLKASGAEYLLIVKTGPAGAASELDFVQSHPVTFRPVVDNNDAAVFRIRRR